MPGWLLSLSHEADDLLYQTYPTQLHIDLKVSHPKLEIILCLMTNTDQLSSALEYVLSFQSEEININAK